MYQWRAILGKVSVFFKFLKFQKIKNVTVECDYCNYAGFGNDYRCIGTVNDLFERFWSFWVRCGASMITFPLYFYIVKSNFFLTYKITVKIFFFWKSNNGFPLMALNLTYMWIIVAKLAKLQKSIFSRGTPNNSNSNRRNLLFIIIIKKNETWHLASGIKLYN